MNSDKKVAVIGLGYVGLPLAVAIANSGFEVLGIDTNEEIVKALNIGRSHIAEISDFQLEVIVKNGSFKAQTNSKNVSSCQIILICVPTPLTTSNLPDLSYLSSAVTSISKHLVKGQLVVLESTVAPGTTRELFMPLLYKNSALQPGDLYIAFSPERIDPGNSKWNLGNTPKLISAIDIESERLAIEFYSSFISKIHICSTLEVAESAKLLENSFRLINISFINEFAKFCDAIGIDINLVIDAASTKPYGFMPFRRSLGAGGHCIPVDPIYLINKAQEVGVELKTVELAAQINDDTSNYFADKATDILEGLHDKRILIIGVSYKPNVSDVRETPAERLIDKLKSGGAHVFWHDELVGKWRGEHSVPLDSHYDLAIIATRHDYLDLSKLGEVQILDTQGTV